MIDESLKISIITVCYNAGETIERTIRSVVNQTYSNIEYIIIDGASTDDTMPIVEQYHEYISVIVSEKDNGIYNAMNKGIQKATGDYIGLLNADDWYEIDAIEKVVAIAQTISSNVGIISGQINFVRDEQIQGRTRCKDVNKIWEGMPVAHPATFVKKSVYDEVGLFDETLKVSADYDFIFRCYIKGIGFHYIDSIIVNFSMSGVSCTERRKVFDDDILILNRYKGFCTDELLVDKTIEGKRRMLALYEVNRKDIETILRGFTDIYIWGCGYWGHELLYIFEKNSILINGFIDNNSAIWGTNIMKYKVFSPEILKEKTCTVLIGIKEYNVEICEQIQSINKEISIIKFNEFIKQAYEVMICK